MNEFPSRTISSKFGKPDARLPGTAPVWPVFDRLSDVIRDPAVVEGRMDRTLSGMVWPLIRSAFRGSSVIPPMVDPPMVILEFLFKESDEREARAPKVVWSSNDAESPVWRRLSVVRVDSVRMGLMEPPKKERRRNQFRPACEYQSKNYLLGRLLSPVIARVFRPTRNCMSSGRVVGTPGVTNSNVFTCPSFSQLTPAHVQGLLSLNQPALVKAPASAVGRRLLIACKAQNWRTLPCPMIDGVVVGGREKSFGMAARIGTHSEQGYVVGEVMVLNEEMHEATAGSTDEVVVALAEAVVVDVEVPVPVV